MNRIRIIFPCSCNLSPSSNNPEMQPCVLTTLRISSLAAAHIFNCLASFNIIFWRNVTLVGCDLSIIDWALLTMDNIDWKIVEIIKPVMTWTTSASETPSPEQLQTNTRYETEPKEFWENLQYYKVKWFFWYLLMYASVYIRPKFDELPTFVLQNLLIVEICAIFLGQLWCEGFAVDRFAPLWIDRIKFENLAKAISVRSVKIIWHWRWNGASRKRQGVNVRWWEIVWNVKYLGAKLCPCWWW